MQGMSRRTGQPMKGRDHLRQSIEDILTTPIGSRVMRRDYGSRIPEYVDRPMNDALLVDLYADSAIAIAKWEKRFKMLSATVTGRNESGRIMMDIRGKDLIDGSEVVLEGIVL